MNDTKKAQKILELLEQKYGLTFETELGYEQDWQLLVAVSLSAQTTDANVNKVTPTLFSTYKTPKELGRAPLEEIEKIIFSTGYYKSKAQRIKALCKDLDEQFNGTVPDTMEELTSLPGVGRKTANVILHILHKKSEGIVVDTHIARVTHRLGFTKKKNPEKAEHVMMNLLPKNQWKDWGDLLIQHGRNTCTAKKPRCKECVLNKLCPSKDKV